MSKEYTPIDTKALNASVDLRTLAKKYTTLKSKTASEMAGPCPVCGGDDRFYVQKDFFACRNCHEIRGNAIDFIMWADNKEFLEACKALGAVIPEKDEKKPTPQPAADPGNPPPADWQKAAGAVIADCEAALWGAGGARALAWLKARGLWEETLLGWRVGYCPKDGKYHGLYMDRGIVIPWLAGDEVWKLNIRRPVGDPKYRAVKGSHSAGALFGVDRLMGKPDCVITEGEFDLMVIWQECGDLADVLTMGSNTGHVSDRWLPALLQYRRFWIATDNDEAGDRAAQYWLTLTGERGRRLTPPKGKDITDSLLAGVALHDWLEAALSGGFE
jgi:DNA primase